MLSPHIGIQDRLKRRSIITRDLINRSRQLHIGIYVNSFNIPPVRRVE